MASLGNQGLPTLSKVLLQLCCSPRKWVFSWKKASPQGQRAGRAEIEGISSSGVWALGAKDSWIPVWAGFFSVRTKPFHMEMPVLADLRAADADW